MKLFTPLYDKVMIWSRHRHAPRYLAGLSFAESSFFPIPPDVMLAPMALGQPQRAWYFAHITTIASVAGGILGYVIGMFFFDVLEPYLHEWGQWQKFEVVQQWFDQWGFVAIFIAGFTPVPYKIFTISAGLISMAFIPFVLASFIGRGARFFLVAGLMLWGGEKMEAQIRKYIDWLGWIVLALLVVLYLVFRH